MGLGCDNFSGRKLGVGAAPVGVPPLGGPDSRALDSDRNHEPKTPDRLKAGLQPGLAKVWPPTFARLSHPWGYQSRAVSVRGGLVGWYVNA